MDGYVRIFKISKASLQLCLDKESCKDNFIKNKDKPKLWKQDFES